MKMTTTTQVSVDGVMEGNGDQKQNRTGFERGGWARPLFDNEAMTFVDQVYQRADAFLFGRRTYELFAGYWGVREDLENPIVGALNTKPKLVCPVVVGRGARLFPDSGPDIALDLVETQAYPEGITLQVYRPAGRPRYAAD
jgi:hypothetical protein